MNKAMLHCRGRKEIQKCSCNATRNHNIHKETLNKNKPNVVNYCPSPCHNQGSTTPAPHHPANLPNKECSTTQAAAPCVSVWLASPCWAWPGSLACLLLGSTLSGLAGLLVVLVLLGLAPCPVFWLVFVCMGACVRASACVCVCSLRVHFTQIRGVRM